MNLVQAKQFVELGQASFKENIPKQQIFQYKTCLRVFQRSRELNYAEKIRFLELLQSKIALKDEHDPLIKKVQSVVASIQADQQRIENRIHLLALRYRNQFEDAHHLFVDYAILDSLPELPGCEEGLAENLSIQFFLSHLKNFYPASPSIEVSLLIQSLENLFELSIYILYLRYYIQDPLPHPMRSFKSKVLNLLIQMSDGRLPYFFLPCCSENHAMVGKVEWFDREGYRFTLINTGSGVRFHEGKKAFDAVYSGLTQKEVMNIAIALLVESAKSTEVYAKIAEALPLQKTIHYNSRGHGVQKRDSCAVKSLTASMHSVLTEKTYWRFKVFYTEKLMSQMTPGAKQEAALQILAKRTKKIC